MFNKVYLFLTIILGITNVIHAQQKESPSWLDFAQKKLSGNLSEAILSDYSFSGYHFSEKTIPDVSGWNTLSVLDYGAIANDEIYDDTAIQQAIDAAEASGVPTVVYFPAGKYLVSSQTTANTPIVINKSNIVLKGAGSGNGGTEIYADEKHVMPFPYRFQFKPSDISSKDITKVISEIKKGDFEVEVVSTSSLSVGQSVDLYQKNPSNLNANMAGLSYNPVWVPIINNGIRPYEKHIISAISGNRITFKNPVQLNMPLHNSTVLKTYNTIEEVGIEGILFTSGWKNYPEDMKHHANDIVDYAWRAVQFESVKNGWIRDCEFKDWNEVIEINRSVAITVKDIEITGKKGHASYYSRYSYGVLFENCVDNAILGLSKDAVKGMVHGPGLRWSTTSTVFLNCDMQKHQSIDCHGYHPYGNLLDNVAGGTVRGNGGAENAYPNSGPYMTFWNFKHDSNYSNRVFDFWDHVDRKTHTYAYPIFVGFQDGSGENISFKNEGLDELRGEQVYPNSLFNAQLQLRLYGGYMSASSSKNDFKAQLANDKKNNTFWQSESTGSGEWLMLDLGIDRSISEVTIKEEFTSIKDWKLEYWDTSEWKELATGTEIGDEKNITFNIVSARKLRFTILNMLSGQESASAAIIDFEIGSGQFFLASDNFTIETKGETCAGMDNGKVVINGKATHDYVAKIDGVDYEFNKNKTIENLSPGTYDLCIEVVGKNFKHCYQLNIEGAVTLSGKMSVTKKSVLVSVQSGEAPYKVFKNGVQIFETYQTNFSLDVNHGDKIEVKSKTACQGELLKTINLLEDIKAYPNPSSGIYELFIPNNIKTLPLEIYNIRSQLIVAKTYQVKAGKVKINISDKPEGIYFVKVNSDKPSFIKLIKN